MAGNGTHQSDQSAVDPILRSVQVLLELRSEGKPTTDLSRSLAIILRGETREAVLVEVARLPDSSLAAMAIGRLKNPVALLEVIEHEFASMSTLARERLVAVLKQTTDSEQLLPVIYKLSEGWLVDGKRCFGGSERPIAQAALAQLVSDAHLREIAVCDLVDPRVRLAAARRLPAGTIGDIGWLEQESARLQAEFGQSQEADDRFMREMMR